MKWGAISVESTERYETIDTSVSDVTSKVACYLITFLREVIENKFGCDVTFMWKKKKKNTFSTVENYILLT